MADPWPKTRFLRTDFKLRISSILPVWDLFVFPWQESLDIDGTFRINCKNDLAFRPQIHHNFDQVINSDPVWVLLYFKLKIRASRTAELRLKWLFSNHDRVQTYFTDFGRIDYSLTSTSADYDWVNWPWLVLIGYLLLTIGGAV